MEFCHLVCGSCSKHEVSPPVVVFQINSAYCLCQFSSLAKELDILSGDGVAFGSCDFHCLNFLTVRIHGPLHVSHCPLFISHAIHSLCESSFGSSFFSWWYCSCTIVLFVNDIMFEACAFPSLIFPVRGKKFMFTASGETIFLVCDFHALLCLLGPIMSARPTLSCMQGVLAWSTKQNISRIEPICHCCSILSGNILNSTLCMLLLVCFSQNMSITVKISSYN